MDSKKEEQLVSTVQIGKTAELALNHLIPLLQFEHESAIAGLKHAFSEGMKDNQKITMELARLVVVDNLEAKLKSQVANSQRARKELENAN